MMHHPGHAHSLLCSLCALQLPDLLIMVNMWNIWTANGLHPTCTDHGLTLLATLNNNKSNLPHAPCNIQRNETHIHNTKASQADQMLIRLTNFWIQQPTNCCPPSSMAGSSKKVRHPSDGSAAATHDTPNDAVAPSPTSVFMSGRPARREEKPLVRISRPGPVGGGCVVQTIERLARA